ncbi:MAG: hypothetical protein JXB46_01555, partial [Candidatus Eisenbacteria bacterium]|nr:hypothetical protein [Candidatus Eisenbacteria bacterium]
VLVVSAASADFATTVFYLLHPLHVVLSALVTTSMYRLHGGGRAWAATLIGYSGSIGVATVSDSVIPYLGGLLLGVDMQFHIPFLEGTPMPVIGVQKWIVVNSCAIIGIAVGCVRPVTRFPHAGHVLLSTWASLFSFAAFGVADWLPLLAPLFVFLFIAVWLPCCASDIIYPMLWTGADGGAAENGGEDMEDQKRE